MVTERNLPVDQPETVETQTASSSTQHQTNGTELPALNCPSPADKQQVGVTDISPLPQVSYSGTRKRRAETSEVLTGTPYKNRLLDSVTRKNVGCRRMLHADKNSTASERTDSQSKCRKEQNKQTPSARVGSKSKPSCAQKARTFSETEIQTRVKDTKPQSLIWEDCFRLRVSEEGQQAHHSTETDMAFREKWTW